MFIDKHDTTPVTYGAPFDLASDLTADEADRVLRLLGDGTLAADPNGTLRAVVEWVPNTLMLRATRRAAETVCGRIVGTLMRNGDTMPPEERAALEKVNDRVVSAIVRFTEILRTAPAESKADKAAAHAAAAANGNAARN